MKLYPVFFIEYIDKLEFAFKTSLFEFELHRKLLGNVASLFIVRVISFVLIGTPILKCCTSKDRIPRYSFVFDTQIGRSFRSTCLRAIGNSEVLKDKFGFLLFASRVEALICGSTNHRRRRGSDGPPS